MGLLFSNKATMSQGRGHALIMVVRGEMERSRRGEVNRE